MLSKIYFILCLVKTAVPNGFSLALTKGPYLVTDALGPYFKQEVTYMTGEYFSSQFCMMKETIVPPRNKFKLL